MIYFIIGTRPEIIKMSPIIRECQKKDLDYFILHTGQHYSYEMDKVFFNNLELQKPKYNLDIGGSTHGEQTGKMLIKIEKILIKEKPDIVLVEGDTNSVLAGGLTASKLHIKLGHVEAGLRSYDWRMPEEKNRLITDHLSDYLFAPTENSKNNLLKEGIEKNKIYVTGNTIVDAIFQNLKIANKKSNILKDLDLERKNYFLLTVHREENVDVKPRLKEILDGLEFISEEFRFPIIYPIHPRTRKRIKEFNLQISDNFKLIEPLGFLDFLQLEANARLVLTDSGGLQEETCVLKVPCVTLRDSTERPETVEIGANIISGVNSKKILESTRKMFQRETDWKNPFGDGKTGEKIIKIILNNLNPQ